MTFEWNTIIQQYQQSTYLRMQISLPLISKNIDFKEKRLLAMSFY